MLLARMHMHLMSYQAAYDTVHLARLLFPEDAGLKKEVASLKRTLSYINDVKARTVRPGAGPVSTLRPEALPDSAPVA